ncbi:hypothetical protein PENSPDRAFT_671301 [Peniophora sp. CONT]|nr:hypothetical protein PENSPDRAFT_671301 [Peniophora sp. CONT]
MPRAVLPRFMPRAGLPRFAPRQHHSRRTKVCPTDIDELLEIHWDGELKPHDYVTSIPGLAHIASVIEGAPDEFQQSTHNRAQTDTPAGPGLQSEDLHALGLQLVALDRSLLGVRNRFVVSPPSRLSQLIRLRALHTQSLLAREIRNYKSVVDASMIPLWLGGPAPPAALLGLFTTEIDRYLDAVQEVDLVLQKLKLVLDRAQLLPGSQQDDNTEDVDELAWYYAALAGNLPEKRRAADVRVDSNTTFVSLENLWNGCMALQEGLQPFLYTHLHRVSEFRRRYFAGETRSCSSSPGSRDSLYRDRRRIVSMIEVTFSSVFGQTEKDLVEREIAEREAVENWIEIRALSGDVLARPPERRRPRLGDSDGWFPQGLSVLRVKNEESLDGVRGAAVEIDQESRSTPKGRAACGMTVNNFMSFQSNGSYV